MERCCNGAERWLRVMMLAWLGGCASDAHEPSVEGPTGSEQTLRDGGLDASRVLDASAPAPSDAATAEQDAGDASLAKAWSVADPSAAIERWLAYTRAPSFSVRSESVRVPMRDGATLACTLARPAEGLVAASGKHPGLVLELTPYALLGSFFAEEAAFFNKRGYNTLVCTVRGVGGSDGSWQGAASSQDRRDAHDLVEWLASQPYSDGRIGQFGESYGAGTSYGGATERPPHLLAIAPQQSPGDLYHDVNYPGGVETVRDGKVNSWPPIAQLTSFFAIDAEAEYAAWHAHPRYDAYWQERAIASRVGQIEVPILAIGGWVDHYFRSGTLSNVEAALARTWTFYGQWDHLYPVDLEACGLVPCAEQPLPSGVLLAWFDRWLMQRDTPVPDAPTFVSEEGPRGATSRWRELEAWLPDGPGATLQLGANGVLAPTAPEGTLRFRQPGEVSETGKALRFDTAPLSRDHVWLGHATLSLRATLSAPEAIFYVQLLDVDASDSEVVVNDGFLKASARLPTPAADYTIEVRAQHYRFVAGHRLRLRIWGGASDTVVPVSAPVDVEVQTGASRLHISGWTAI